MILILGRLPELWEPAQVRETFSIRYVRVGLIEKEIDTTSIGLRSFIYFMIQNPRCYQKLLAELEEAVEEGRLHFPCVTFLCLYYSFLRAMSNRTPHAEGIKLTYLQASIRESIRNFPGRSHFFFLYAGR